MERLTRAVISIAFLLVLTWGASVARAQTGTTSIHGVVTDKTGAVIVGAKVALTNPAQAFQREVKTAATGEYEFTALPPGTYSLTIEMAGFRRYQQRDIQLLVNSPSTVNAALEVGTTTEIVEVSAQAATLNTTDASLGNAFSEDQIKSLPLEAGNVPELLSLQAGVTYTGNRPDINRDMDTRNGAVNGAHSDQSNITLDGVDVNADSKGYAFQSVLPITQDSVQEFRVTTSNYNADEGRSSGAQVALVTKSGTNNFHGSAFELHRNTYTSANDYFVKLAQQQGCVNSGTPLSHPECNEPPKLIRNIFGGSLGGPIKKDRFFFFVNYQGGRQREAQSVVRIVPSDALRDGVITYQCAVPTQCSDGTLQVSGINGPHTIPAGYYALSPNQIQAMDPQGVGISRAVMIPYFNTFPHSNDNSVGDGVNFQAFRFTGPVAINTNWYIARADYKLSSNGNHSLFWRGALRNDTNAGVPYFPGGGPELAQVDYSKGFTVGYVAVLRSNLINNFHWGFTRQSFGEVGNQSAPVVFFRGLNDNSSPNNASLAVTNSLLYQVPVHNFVDDVSWTKGKHTLSFGTNVNFLRNPQSSNVNSWSAAVTNASWFVPSGLANQKIPGQFDPGCSQTATPATANAPTTNGCFDAATNPSSTEPHFPLVNPLFNNSYDYPMIALVGMVNQVNAQYNFTRNGTPLKDGTAVTRRFADDAYEMYAQDSWKMKTNLTLTYGLRYSLFSPPWETNGLQVIPTVNLRDWFATRVKNMEQGIPSNAAPLISFILGGPANGKPGFYNWDYKDLAPRLALAYSPSATSGLLKGLFGGPGKTSIRAGAGMVYDRLGPALLATFDQSGSFGLSTSLTPTAGTVSTLTAPRITGLNVIPTKGTDGTVMFPPPPASSFPQTFPATGAGSFAVYFGLDQGLKTPYAYTLDFSIGRDLGHNLSLEVAYVGRLSHRLLSQVDVATPEDIVDPKTKVDYFTAVRALAKLYRQTNPDGSAKFPTSSVTPQLVGSAAQYWADMIQPLKSGDAYSLVCSGGSTMSTLQAAYDLFSCFNGNETTAIQLLDQGILTGALQGSNGNPLNTYYASGGPYTFLDPQFAALYAWRSNSNANYHALQVNLRKHMPHGVQFDFNYTYSKSIDISSDANRISAEGGLGGQVINAWSPNALRAVSDFDTTHQLNANWVADLPFGKNRWIGRNSHGPLEAIIGGWQLSGLTRWTSGFPVGIANGAQWPTNWQLAGYATQTGPLISRGAVKNSDGTVNVFGNDINANANGPAANALAAFRNDFPGEVGARNTLRGNGFASLDLGLIKTWKIKESHSLRLSWEVFNALNLTRFDVQSLSLSITNSSTFGNYSGLLTSPRVMQFGLRYEF